MECRDVGCVVKVFGGYFSSHKNKIVGVIVQERAAANLDEFLRKHGATLPVAARVDLCLQVLNILHFFQWGLRVVHNDLKANNILVAGGERLLASDFGLMVNLERGGRFLDKPAHKLGEVKVVVFSSVFIMIIT